jgi:CHAD domain-containing protein
VRAQARVFANDRRTETGVAAPPAAGPQLANGVSVPTKSKVPPAINLDQTASEAFAAILRHNYNFLLTWRDSARSWGDIEGVHQLRVSFRRMRSAVSLFRDAVPQEATATWNDEMRWIAGELGPARDLDVFIAEGLGPVVELLPLSGAERLLQLAEARRAEIYQQRVVPMLDSDRFECFVDSFPHWLDARAWEAVPLNKKQAKRLHSGIVGYSRRLLDKQERRVLGAGTHVNRDDAAEMHRLRIECKKLRYATEFFLPLFDGMDVFIGHMKGLQDLLGVMNDVAVTQHLLDDLLTGNSDRELFVYVGGLVGWRSCEFRHLLSRFDDYWEELTEAKHPWWKKQARGS